MPNLFHYLDYRHYLRDFYQEQKGKRGQGFSFRTFSRQAGLKSPNFLKLVMEGKRNLGDDGVECFSKGLKLNAEEASFFHNLVYFNQAVTDEERSHWYEKIARSKKYREVKGIEADQFLYYSRWYFSAVRELVLLRDFQENPEWIAKKIKPQIHPQEAREALELLLRLGFLVRRKDKKLSLSERNISTAREVESLAISNYHREMLAKASLSMQKTHASQRDISSLTIAVSQKRFEEAKRRIQDFRRELNVLLSEEEKPDAVYQINFQIFNLSEVPWPAS